MKNVKRYSTLFSYLNSFESGERFKVLDVYSNCDTQTNGEGFTTTLKNLSRCDYLIEIKGSYIVVEKIPSNMSFLDVWSMLRIEKSSLGKVLRLLKKEELLKGLNNESKHCMGKNHRSTI